jgi:protein-disulfide isomerase
MHERLFETTGEWSGQSDPTEQFTSYATDLGLDTDAFVACLESGETSAQVQAEFEQGLAAGVQGAPAFFINDWFLSGAQPLEEFQRVIKKALKGEHPPPTPTPLPPGATLFDPNPERPGYTYGGDATLGSAEAELVLIEFIDFQSPENRELFQETWTELEKEYVEPGKVRFVVKHFPASDQPQGFKAAEAAECAGQQEDFWSMHDLLFQKQEEWSEIDDVTATFEEYAAELDLDVDAFVACLDEGQTRDKVEEDFTITQENQFPSAPMFFILMGSQVTYVPIDQLQEAIEQSLEQ